MNLLYDYSYVFLIIAAISGIIAAILFLRTGTLKTRILAIVTIGGVAISTLYMLRNYYPPLESLFTALPTLESIQAIVMPILAFIKDNVYGVVVGALSVVGGALKWVSNNKKNTTNEIATATESFDTAKDSLTGSLKAAGTENNVLTNANKNLQLQLNDTNGLYQTQNKELLAAREELAKLKEDMNRITSMVEV